MKTLLSANPQESSGWKPVTGCDRGDPLAQATPPHEASQPAMPSSSKPEGPPAHTSQKRFTCPQVHCAKTFSSKYKLCRHVATHSLQKSHQCIHCGKMFHRKDHLKNHLQTHNPNKEALQCPECSKHYSTKHGHRRHLALHAAASGDLSCKLCLQVFTDSQAVLEHLKSHSRRPSGGSKEKKYSCEHCDRCFYTRKDVRRHLVVHTGRKDFQCHFCLQRFGRKDHLTRHLKKSHLEEMPHIKSEPPDTLSHMSYGSAMVKEEFAPFMCLQPRDLMPTGMYSTPFQAVPDSGFSHSLGPNSHLLGPNNPTNSTASFSAAPTTRFPRTTTSYLPKNEMDGFFSEASGCLSLSSSEVSSAVSQPLAEEAFLSTLCDPLSATGVDFNHFLGFLPVNACNIPVSASSTIMGFPQAEVQPLPLTLSHSQALGFSGTVAPCPPPVCTSEFTASTLPRFHQAFK